MNRYYGVLFEPVKRRGGFILHIKGHGMLALWATRLPDHRLREQACLAALEIAHAAQRFDIELCLLSLPTRIALHCGDAALGNVETADHVEYRAVGDIVNTASRLQALNKDLGTQILLSQEVIDGIDGLVTWALGRFLLRGKIIAIELHELLRRVATDRFRYHGYGKSSLSRSSVVF